MKKVLSFIFLFCFSFSSHAQSDSSHLRISLLTCSAGEELYSTFGHSAVRIIDSLTFTDKVYNYGTFDNFSPGFYSEFIRGKLLYYLSVENFPDFVYSYQLEQRSIVEQELNLTGEEKIKLNAALRLNAHDDHKFYKYDFLFDNCATRIRDIVRNNISDTVSVKNILPYPEVTFRELIHNSLNRNKMYWSKLGIDLLLGSGLDKIVRNEQAMFLPDYLYKGFDSAVVDNRPLVGTVSPVYHASTSSLPKSFFTPFVSFSAVFMLFLILTFIHRSWSRKLLGLLDFSLFLGVGLLGILLILMWVGTDHVLCRNNYNLFWAIPLHVVSVFFLNSNRKIWHQYWALSVLVYVLLLSFWVLLPQELNKDLVPLIILLVWRSWKYFKRSESVGKNA